MVQFSLFNDAEGDLASQSKRQSKQETYKPENQPQPNQSDKVGSQTRLPRPATGKSAAKRIVATAVQRIELSTPAASPEPQSEHKVESLLEPARWGCCRVCGSPIGIAAFARAVAQATRRRRHRETIGIPSHNASLCANPAHTAGSSGWGKNALWMALFSNLNQGGTAS